MAGRNIKGITIEIDGDTKKLSKSLSTVDKSLKTTQQKLKDINRLLKFNPKNTELLKQKQKALADSITQTKQRLNELKKAQQTAEQQLKQGKIGQEEYDALQREIVETESKLKNLEKKYKEFGSVAKQQLQQVGKEMQEFGGKVTEVGENITKNVTGPILALGGASLAAFKSVDSGYDEMIKKTGATGKEAEGLRQILENVATNVPTDFDTAGKAIGEIATRFDVAGADLEYLSEKFIKFADLNNTDVTQSIDSVQKAMAAYGVPIENADNFLDRLNKTSQETGSDVTKLSDGIVSNSAAFKELGFNVDQAVSFMGRLDKSGVNSETVMNGLRKALKNATKDGKPLNQALEELQDTIENGDGSIDGLTASYDLFGKSGDQVYDAVKNGSLDFRNLADTVTDAGGSIDDTFEEINDPIKNFQTTLNKLKIVGAEVAEPLIALLVPAIQKLGDFIGKLKEKWEGLSPAQQDMIIKAALIAAAVGPVLVIIGKIITVVGTLISAIGFLISPIGAVIAIIGLAIAAGIALYKNWDAVKAWAIKVWTAIKDFIVKAVQYIKKSIEDHIKRVYTFWVNIWNKVKNFFRNIWQGLKSDATSFASGLKDAIMAQVNRIHDFWTNIWNKVKDFFSNIWGVMKDKASQGVQGMADTISNKLSSLKNTWTNKWNEVKNAVSNVWENIKSAISGKISSIETAISNFVSRVKDKINGIMTAIGNASAAAAGVNAPSTPTKKSTHTISTSALAPDNELLATNPATNSILALLEAYLPYLAEQQDIYIDGDKLVGATAPAINKTLGMIQIRERRR